MNKAKDEEIKYKGLLDESKNDRYQFFEFLGSAVESPNRHRDGNHHQDSKTSSPVTGAKSFSPTRRLNYLNNL